jgi:SAM-dependent methyltransferase
VFPTQIFQGAPIGDSNLLSLLKGTRPLSGSDLSTVTISFDVVSGSLRPSRRAGWLWKAFELDHGWPMMDEAFITRPNDQVLNSATRPDTLSPVRALFVNHRGDRCGVYQFGVRLYAALSSTQVINWHYLECADQEDFLASAECFRPHAILANYHPHTLAWAAGGLGFPSAMTFAVFHEASQSSIEHGRESPFDALLCPDPTLLPYDPFFRLVPRFIPAELPDPKEEPEVFTVGSFGFGTHGKGFDKLCAIVNEQFDSARIRINIPPHDSEVMVRPDSIKAIVTECRRQMTKPGITLEITHDFLDESALLGFLASNTINAFLYDDAPSRGLSSCIDYALACRRPVAINRTSMFRHLHGVNPSICVEDRPLRSIAASGIGPLQQHRAAYNFRAAGEAWNRTILDSLDDRRNSRSVPDGRGFNKILDDRSREAYGPVIGELRRLAPDMLKRKIERANVQQAFAFDATCRLAPLFAQPRILAVGSYEDTAVASLKALGFQVDEVDPQVNGLDLATFYASTKSGTYELILCTSVLEHVSDDERFVQMIGELLAYGGIAIFTLDFSNNYPQTGKCPSADRRLYTANDLRQRLREALLDCTLLDSPDWDSDADDFEYEGCNYSFATWVFRRVKLSSANHPLSARVRQSGALWKQLLEEKSELLVVQQQRAELPTCDLNAADRLNTLLQELALKEGPRALRIVLPVARLIRRVHLLFSSQARVIQHGPIVGPNLVGPAIRRDAPVASRPSIGRRVCRGLYYLALRPIVRPLAWRGRGFLSADILASLAEIRQELATVRHALQASVARPDAMNTEASKLIRALEDALVTILVQSRDQPLNRAVANADQPSPARPQWTNGSSTGLASE